VPTIGPPIAQPTFSRFSQQSLDQLKYAPRCAAPHPNLSHRRMLRRNFRSELSMHRRRVALAINRKRDGATAQAVL
jgi:hypothetical protein